MHRYLRLSFRLAFGAGAILSLLVLLAGIRYWPRSYGHVEGVRWTCGSSACDLCSANGRLLLSAEPTDPPPPPWSAYSLETMESDDPWSYAEWETLADPDSREYRYLGVQLFWPATPGRWSLEIPFSYLLILSPALPILWLYTRLRRRSRNRPGFPVEPPLPPTTAAR